MRCKAQCILPKMRIHDTQRCINDSTFKSKAMTVHASTWQCFKNCYIMPSILQNSCGRKPCHATTDDCNLQRYYPELTIFFIMTDAYPIRAIKKFQFFRFLIVQSLHTTIWFTQDSHCDSNDIRKWVILINKSIYVN